MKYFCISEATAFYLQKYIVYRKRKIFYGDKKVDDMTKILLKHKTEFSCTSFRYPQRKYSRITGSVESEIHESYSL